MKFAESDKPEKAKRGTVIFSSDSHSVTDNKDHFPINDIKQARNALARVAQYSSLPDWYKGSMDLAALQKHVQNAVKKAFPSISVTEKESSKDFIAMEDNLDRLYTMTVKEIQEAAKRKMPSMNFNTWELEFDDFLLEVVDYLYPDYDEDVVYDMTISEIVEQLSIFMDRMVNKIQNKLDKYLSEVAPYIE